jgi:excisionase family DNA binding protein
MAPNQKEPVQPVTISTREAAQLLGIHYVTAKNYVRRGVIPSVKVGGRRLIPKQAIRELIMSAYEQQERGGRR